MKTKLNAVVIAVMMYVQFMGPFVLKANSEGHQKSRILADFWREMGSDYKHQKEEFKTAIKEIDIHNPIYFLGSLIFLALMACFYLVSRGLLIMGWVVLKFFEGILIVGFNILLAVVNIWESIANMMFGRRSLAQTGRDGHSLRSLAQQSPKDGKPAMSQTEKENLELRIKKYTKRIAERIGLPELEAKAKEKTLGKLLSKVGSFVFGESVEKILPPLDDNQMKIALRKLFETEIADFVEMNGEISKVSTQPGEPIIAYHYCVRKIRRKYLKLRIGRATDLINTNMYQEKKFKTTLEYKRTVFPTEIAAIEKVLKDKKSTDKQRQDESEKLKELLRREDPSKDSKTVNKELSLKTEMQYAFAGIPLRWLTMKFFMSYNKASYIIIFKKEKIQIEMHASKNDLSADTKLANEQTIKELDKAIAECEKGVDLN